MMKSNPLLEEKWATQARLAKAAKHDIKTMMQNGERLLAQTEKKLGIKFVVAKRKAQKPKIV